MLTAMPTPRRREQPLPVDLERGLERRAQPLGHAQRGVHVRDVVEQDRELVAAQPRHGEAGRVRRHDVGIAQACLEALGDRDQQSIRHLRAQAVVDRRQAVEAEHSSANIGSGRRCVRLMAWSSRSTNRKRFGKPVSASKTLASVTSVSDPASRVAAPSAARTAAPRQRTQRYVPSLVQHPVLALEVLVLAGQMPIEAAT